MVNPSTNGRPAAVAEPRWLNEQEQRAWRGLVADARDAIIDQFAQTELKALATFTGKVRRRLATLDPVP